MKKLEEPHFSKVVTTADIEEENFNLSVTTYVEQEDTREEIVIEELNARIDDIVKRQNSIRSQLEEIIQEIEEGAA